MGNLNGTKGEDSCTWDEEERRNSYSDPCWSGDVRSESSIAGDKPERTYRAYSQRASFIELGSSSNGGVFRELIAEYRSQVALKLGMINSLQEEVKQLESRIQQFETLQSTIEKQLIEKH